MKNEMTANNAPKPIVRVKKSSAHNKEIKTRKIVSFFEGTQELSLLFICLNKR